MPEQALQTLRKKFETRLAEKRTAEGEPTYDYQSGELAEDFPSKARPGVAAELLEKELWWWNRATQQSCHEIFQFKAGAGNPQDALKTFTEYQQLSAYYYELRARYGGRYEWEFGRPWLLCSREQRDFLEWLWPMENAPTLWRPSQKNVKGWVKLPARQINLKANDSALTQQFLEEVERLRRQHNIKRPTLGQGVRRKPVSFLPIELMDKRHYLEKPLNDSQRSQVSKAERAYASACATVGIEP